MYGWAGTILDVDLSSGNIEKRPVDTNIRKKYLGGRGVNSMLLYEGVKPGIDPLGPENMLIFGTGILAGTMVPASSRINVTAKTPVYKGVGVSNAGGSFAPELRRAGYDHIIMRGAAGEPVYLWIDDDHIELRCAAHLWGKSTWETEQMIKEELGDPDIKVCSIGVAGEKLVHFAGIIFNLYRAAGQSGMGAVMGSKKLKAVAVRGTKSIEVAKPDEIKRISHNLVKRIITNPAHPKQSTIGTGGTLMRENSLGVLGVKNFQQSGPWVEGANLYPEKINEYYTGTKGCYACPIHCSHYFEIKNGPYKGEMGGGIEYGVLQPLGAMLGNSDLASIFKCLNLCNQYGLDTMDLGSTIGAACEWYEKGIITQKDLDGIDLRWGNAEAIIDIIHKIANREGIGDVLAEGPVHAAERIGKGAMDYVSHCKGMPVGCDDPRILRGIALNAVTATIPAHHEDGMIGDYPGFPCTVYGLELGRKMFGPDADKKTIDPLSYKKANAVLQMQNLCRLADAIEICKFATNWTTQEIGFKDASALFFACTGIEISPEEMELAAERINDLERSFIVREGMSRKDDYFHGKIAKEPVQTGPFKGEMLDLEKFDAMLDEYYEVRGWDKETGVPTREKLEKVGLKNVADELEKMGKLAQTKKKGP